MEENSRLQACREPESSKLLPRRHITLQHQQLARPTPADCPPGMQCVASPGVRAKDQKPLAFGLMVGAPTENQRAKTTDPAHSTVRAKNIDNKQQKTETRQSTLELESADSVWACNATVSKIRKNIQE